MGKRKFTNTVSLKRRKVLLFFICSIFFMGVGYSFLTQSFLFSATVEVAKLKVTVNSGEYLQHGTKSGTDCPAGSFCPGNTFSYNAVEDQGLVSCALGSFSAVRSGVCTPCQGNTTSSTGSTSCDTDCSNKAGVDSWETTTWNNNNSLTNLCTISTCSTGYTKNDNVCSPNTYTITLDNDNATTPGSSSVTVTYDSDIPTITPPTKRGYDFGGYNNVIAHQEPTPNEEILYIKSDGTSNRKWDIASDKTLIAKWNVSTITCEAGEYLPGDGTSCSSCPAGYSCSGGDYNYNPTTDQGTNICPSGTYSTGGATTCTTCSNPSSQDPGQTSCSSACSNAAHVASFSTGCTIATCDTGYENISNECVARTFTVTLDNDNATTPGSTSVTTTYDSFVPSITVPEKTGYTFGGYYTEADGAGVQYIKDDGTSARTWNVTNVTTLYAKWTVISKTCSAGQYLPQSSTTCSSCPAGSFCEGGTYNYNASSDQGIDSCAVGTYSSASSSTCTACTGLTTSGTGQTSCNASCSNSSNVSTWNTGAWNNNIPTNICSINQCTVGYSLSNNVCEANALDFSSQTINSEYSSDSVTKNVTAPTTGTGTYTYSKKSGESDITVSSTGEITIPALKAVGEYTIVITATDSNSNVEKDATYTINVQKAAATLTCENKTYNGSEQTACTCSGGTVGGDYKGTNAGSYTASCTGDANHTNPTNEEWTMAKKEITNVTDLTISNTGIVSWTNSGDADGYQISIDNTNWINVPEGTTTTSYNFLNSIISTTGERTVYVKSVNSDTINYDSSTTNTTTTVYTLLVSANDDNYGTLTPASLNVITGETYSTNNNILTVLDGRTITAIAETGYQFDSFSSVSGTISGNVTLTADFISAATTYHIIFNAGSGTASEDYRDVVAGEAIGTLPTATLTDYALDSWRLTSSNGEEIDSTYIPTGDLTLYARYFPSDKVCEIDGTYYDNLRLAVEAVPTDGTLTTIRLLKTFTVSEAYANETILAAGCNAIIDLRGFTYTNTGNAVIKSSGTLTIKNGTMTCSAGQGAVNLNKDSTMILDNVTVRSTGTRQAVYNKGGNLTIRNSNISTTSSSQRCAVQNLNDGSSIGVTTIESGTITSPNNFGLYIEGGTAVIGVNDHDIQSSPVIQGSTYGVAAYGTLKMYDGILKGKTGALGKATSTGNSPTISVDTGETKITEIDSNARKVNDTESISGDTYQTLYLEPLGTIYTINLNANGGQVETASINVREGQEIGTIPTPTWDEWHTFVGWYTLPSGGTEVTSSYVVNSAGTIYARWNNLPYYTVDLNANGGSVTPDNIKVHPGDSITSIPTPTYEGHFLDDWYTALQSGTPITLPYTPSGDDEIFAIWKLSVASMSIINSNISLDVGDEETINITNAASIDETYTFSSNNTSIATVDQTGKVTGVGPGSTTITITGDESGHTKTVNVTVGLPAGTITITLDANGGSVNQDYIYVDSGDLIGTIPTPTNGTQLFGGWFTASTGGTEVTSDYQPVSDMTIVARWYNSNIVAVMDEVGYTTLAGAIAQVPTDNTLKNIKVLKNTSEHVTVAADKNVVIDLNGKTVSDTASITLTNNGTVELKNGSLTETEKNAIKNTGTMIIKNCNITASNGYGTIDNQGGGSLRIIDSRVESTGTRQALYNDSATASIEGDSYLSTSASQRATVQNLGTGVLNILGGTIEATNYSGLYVAGGTVNIGTKDGNIDVVPVIQGADYGVIAYVTYNFYDGIIKGENGRVGQTSTDSNTPTITADSTKSKIADIETDTEYLEGTEGNYQTLKLTYLTPKYIITLDANGGNVTPASVSVEQGSSMGESLPTPTWDEFHTFDGWYTSLQYSEEVDSNYTPSSNMTVVAKWTELPSYEISFETNGGTSVESYRIPQGSTVGTLPTDTTKAGYYLDGWYLNLESGNKIESNYEPSSDIELKAKWKKSVASMIINPDNITITSPTATETINITNANQIEEAYTFTSNNTDIVTVNQSGVIIPVSEGETTITVTGSISNETKTVTVKVEYVRYTVSFEENGGSEVEDRIVVGGLPMDYIPTTYQDHYFFDGWYTSLQGGIEVDENYLINGDITVYAHFTYAPDYTITFDVNGGDSIDEVTRTVSGDMPLGELPEPTRTNYYFVGWMDETESKYYYSNTQPTKNVTLKAQWDTVERVARINSTYYSSLQDAIDAAQTDDEIILLVDRTESPTNSKKITMNLNNHTVTGQLTNNQGGDLTILNGVLENNGTDDLKIKTIINNGTLTIGSENQKLNDGVDIVAVSTGNNDSIFAYGIYDSSDSTVIMNGGSIRVTTEGSGERTNAFGIYANSNSVLNVTMNGGSITTISEEVALTGNTTSESYGISGSSNVTLNGGNITATSTGNKYVYAYGTKGDLNSTVTMNGGSITITSGVDEQPVAYGLSGKKVIMNGGSIAVPHVGISGTNVTMNGGSIVTEFRGISGTNVTMNDGSIIASTSRLTANTVGISGTNVTMNGGSILSNSPTYGAWGIDGDSNATVIMNGGSITANGYAEVHGIYGTNVTMNGGSIKATSSGNETITDPFAYGISGYNNTVTMTDGIIYSKGVNKSKSYGIEASTKIYPEGKTLHQETSADNYEVYYLTPTSGGITVNFYPGNDGTVSPTSMTKTSGEAIGTLPIPTRDNYYFIGWYTDPNNGTKVTTNTVINSNTDLYAHWTLNPSYTITFDKNNNSATGSMNPQTIMRDNIEPLTTNAYTLTGYQFAGWNTKRDGSGTSYLDEGDITLTKNITLYAQWIRVYTLTFDKNDSNAVGNTYTQTLVSGVSTQLDDAAFSAYTLTSKIIDSYKTSSSNDGTSYYQGQSITITSDTTIYAHWVDREIDFAHDSWQDIVDAVQVGNTNGISVGDTRIINMGSLGKHTLRVANTSTPAECETEGFSQTACGLVIEFEDIVTTHRMNPYVNGDTTTVGVNNKGGWEYSDMRAYLNSTTYAYENIDYSTTGFYSSLPSEVRNSIVNTTVVSGHNSTESINFITTDKIYLLSAHELWEDVDGNPNSGISSLDTAYNYTRQLDYYNNNNVTTSSYMGGKKYYNGLNNTWWLRSAFSLDSYYFYSVNYGGTNVYDAGNTYGVSPAFRIG